MTFYILHAGLMLMLLVSALALIHSKNLLVMAMLFGLYSFQVAGLFILLDAPDVAFTEAAVGTGISTVLMLATLAATGVTHAKVNKAKLMPLLLCLAMGGLLIFATQDLDNLGAAEARSRQGASQHYIELGQQETGVPNLVTAVLASYRGFDTLGEVTVVLTAGLGVMMLLGNRKKPRKKERANAR